MYEAEETWDESRIAEIQTRLLQGVFGCRTNEAVEAAMTYGAYLNRVGITPENCPVYLRMLEIENPSVIDALIGERDPFLLLSSVQPNAEIVGRIFSLLTRWHKGGIYPKSLSVILGVLQSVYSSPKDGYRIFPLTIAAVNALGKHLDKKAGQDDPRNRVILEVLEKISELEDAGNPDMEEVAVHASAIRNAFFDDRKKMEDIIPPILLVTVESQVSIKPRKQMAIEEIEKKEAAAVEKEKKKAEPTAAKKA
jgi:hypothetical protein